MAIIGTLLKRGIKIRETLEQEYSNSLELQKAELQKLLIHARGTEFGNHYNFNQVLNGFRSSDKQFYNLFKERIPIFDYNKIYQEWWNKCLDGKSNVCWPGKVKFFALSSGTAESSSKHIPITEEMIKSIQKTSIRQILTLSKYNIDDSLFTSGILLLGGSTNLLHKGTYFEGDLSGITTSQLPFWFQHFYKPGKKIAQNTDWNKKIDEIAAKAPQWKIGIIVGIPGWIQIMLERIIERNNLNSIHDIWPGLSIYVHGGVSFDPYRKSFERLFSKPLIYLETYLASEGFIAFQAQAKAKSMRIVLNNGIFYEFIPFNGDNFDIEGNLKDNAETLSIEEVEENKEYALLLSTNAGAWRYLIGDTIKFVSIEESEIIITGRTKHFLSLCGEHLSVENMNRAIEMVSQEMNVPIKEFAVAGVSNGTMWSHEWYIGAEGDVNSDNLRDKIDASLMQLNDDYRVERSSALNEVVVRALPPSVFYDYMTQNGKVGGQNKFPRVLKSQNLISWEKFLKENSLY